MSGGAAARRLRAEQHRRPPAIGDGQATAEERPAVRQVAWSMTDSNATVRTTDPGVSCTRRYYFTDLYRQ